MSYSLVKDGFEIVPSVLTEREVEALRDSLSLMKVAPGHRNLMQRVPDIAALAVSPKILGLLEGLLGAEPFPVRSIFFDKTPDANWLVPWHQDLSIAVKQRLDVPGYNPWSMKDGVPPVQPPMKILEAMVTLRLHLDDCDDSNGALRVILNSHQLGRLNAARITEVRSQHGEIACSVRAGDALLMRPLLLHASSEASAPAHRRVIHLEYVICPLAEGLEWAETSKRTA
jgi:ectoine hydroxylase-related dioxygenase (phytanoyl-CoA dioxygenase family)